MLSVNRPRPACGPDRFAALAIRLEGAGRLAYQGRMDYPSQAAGPAEHVALVLRIARDGDRAAFALLFGHFAPRVKGYLLRLGTDGATAEDLMQEVMFTVWRRASTYDPAQAGVATWIFTIARNKRIDVLRRAKRPEFDASDPAFAPDPPAEPDREAERGEWQGHIAAAMAELPAEQSDLLRLAYFEDLSHSDIAARLGLPLGTVKSRLRLAVGRLRIRFSDEV